MESLNINNVKIREAVREDCGSIVDLKKEVVTNGSNMEQLVMLSPKDIERDGFDIEPPSFYCLIAELDSHDQSSPNETHENNGKCCGVIGYALYFYGYSAWEGRTLHLEDLCVKPKFQGRGIGEKLVKEIAQIAVAEDCVRIQFQVMCHNSGRYFYDNLGALNTAETEGRHNLRLSMEQIKKLASN